MRAALPWSTEGNSGGARAGLALALALALLVGGLVLLGLAACGKGSAPALSEPGVVARVGPRRIGVEELQTFVRQMPAALRSRQAPDAARQEYLRSLMARHALGLEARARGLDTVQVVRQRAQSRWRQQLAQLYRQELVLPQVRVDEEQMRRLFVANRLQRERQLAAIVVRSDTAAARVVARLDRGEPFAQVAAQVSVEPRSAAREGVLGYVNVDEAKRLRIPEAVFWQLPAGRVGPVVPVGGNFQVIRFLGERQVSFAEARADLQRQLYEQELARVEAQRVADLATESGWRTEPEGLAALLAAAARRGVARRGDLTDQEAAAVLFRHAGGQVAVGDFVEAVWGNSPAAAARGWGTADSGAVMAAAAELVLPQEMYVEAARRAGLADRPAERAWLDQVTEEFAIQELRRQDILVRTRGDRERARQFYQQHPEAFLRPLRTHIVEVLVGTEPEARQVVAAVRGGQLLEELAAGRTLRSPQQQRGGVMVVDAHVKLEDAVLYQAVNEAPLDSLVGPLRVVGGYSVFQVILREGGDLQAFDEVEPTARLLARKQSRDQLLNELVDGLFDRLGDQLAINQEALVEALPDSLLAPPSGAATVPAAAEPPGSP